MEWVYYRVSHQNQKTKQYLAISTKQLTTLDSVSHVTKTMHEKFYIFAGAEEQCVDIAGKLNG